MTSAGMTIYNTVLVPLFFGVLVSIVYVATHDIAYPPVFHSGVYDNNARRWVCC